MRRPIVVALAFAAALGPAQAADRRSRQPQPAEAYVVPVQYCAKLCPEDFAPCDPVYFKTADARCAQVGVGR